MLLLKQSKKSKTTDSFLWLFIQLGIDRVFLSAFLECIWTAASGCDINESSRHLKQNEMEDSLFIQFQLISAQSLNTNIIWSTVINAERTVPATGVIIWEPFYNILMQGGELFQNIKHFISSQLQDTALKVASVTEENHYHRMQYLQIGIYGVQRLPLLKSLRNLCIGVIISASLKSSCLFA